MTVSVKEMEQSEQDLESSSADQGVAAIPASSITPDLTHDGRVSTFALNVISSPPRPDTIGTKDRFQRDSGLQAGTSLPKAHRRSLSADCCSREGKLVQVDGLGHSLNHSAAEFRRFSLPIAGHSSFNVGINTVPKSELCWGNNGHRVALPNKNTVNCMTATKSPSQSVTSQPGEELATSFSRVSNNTVVRSTKNDKAAVKAKERSELDKTNGASGSRSQCLPARSSGHPQSAGLRKQGPESSPDFAKPFPVTEGNLDKATGHEDHSLCSETAELVTLTQSYLSRHGPHHTATDLLEASLCCAGHQTLSAAASSAASAATAAVRTEARTSAAIRPVSSLTDKRIQCRISQVSGASRHSSCLPSSAPSYLAGVPGRKREDVAGSRSESRRGSQRGGNSATSRSSSSTSSAASSQLIRPSEASSGGPCCVTSHLGSLCPARCVPWEMDFTRDELRQALPRRSFFSSHNRALKEAGCKVGRVAQPRHRRRIFCFRHPVDEVSSGNNPVDTTRHTNSMLGSSETNSKSDNNNNNNNTKLHVFADQDAKNRGNHQDDSSRDTELTSGQEGADDSCDEDNHDGKGGAHDRRVEVQPPTLTVQPAQHSKTRSTVTTHGHSSVTVECKPLQLYLSYVHANPSEYNKMTARAVHKHATSLSDDNCHSARLVQMGKVFEERHKGQHGYCVPADEVLRAAYSLNPRASDPIHFAARPWGERASLLQGLKAPFKRLNSLKSLPKKDTTQCATQEEEGGPSLKQLHTPLPSKSGLKAKPGGETAPAAAAEHCSELEQLKVKAEQWAGALTTDQLLRAKLRVLQELGHEERELTQWWLAFRDCLYLRPRLRDNNRQS